MTIDESFDLIHKHFVDRYYSPIFSVYQFEIEGWGERHLLIKDGVCLVGVGRHRDPDVILKSKAEDYLEIINDKVSLPTAFMLGMIEVTGDIHEAERMIYFFPKEKS